MREAAGGLRLEGQDGGVRAGGSSRPAPGADVRVPGRRGLLPLAGGAGRGPWPRGPSALESRIKGPPARQAGGAAETGPAGYVGQPRAAAGAL